MQRSARTWLLVALALVGVGIGIGLAVADRRPSAPPLVYSGIVLDGPVPIADGSHAIGLALYGASSGGAAVCTIAPTGIATLAGHFSITLADAACQTAMQSAEELWVEISVDGTTMPRGRAGAVPYAVQAERTILRAGTDAITDSGTLCGMSAPTLGRIHGTVSGHIGLQGAHELCAAACSSPTAHMCDTREINHAMALGTTIDLGDPTSGIGAWMSQDGLPPIFGPGGTSAVTDCASWTTSTSDNGYALFPPNTSHEAYWTAPSACTTARPLLCCD